MNGEKNVESKYITQLVHTVPDKLVEHNCFQGMPFVRLLAMYEVQCCRFWWLGTKGLPCQSVLTNRIGAFGPEFNRWRDQIISVQGDAMRALAGQERGSWTGWCWSFCTTVAN